MHPAIIKFHLYTPNVKIKTKQGAAEPRASPPRSQAQVPFKMLDDGSLEETCCKLA